MSGERRDLVEGAVGEASRGPCTLCEITPPRVACGYVGGEPTCCHGAEDHFSALTRAGADPCDACEAEPARELDALACCRACEALTFHDLTWDGEWECSRCGNLTDAGELGA